MSKAKEYKSTILDDFLNEITPEEQEKTDKRMQLAARIDDAIKAKGWKKKDFADAMDKVQSEISKWLSGTHNFNIDTLFNIERVLDIQLVNVKEQSKEQVVKFKLSTSSKVEAVTENMFSDIYSADSYISLMYANGLVKSKGAKKHTSGQKA